MSGPLIDPQSTDPSEEKLPPNTKSSQTFVVKRVYPWWYPCKRDLTFAEILMIILLIIAIIFIIVLIILLCLWRGKTSTTCTTSDCAYQAGKQVAVMDLKANPCTNFYQYACGKWPLVYQPEPGVGKYSNFYRATMKADKRIFQLLTKDDKTLYGKKSTAIEKVKTFFSSCMNMNARGKAGITPLINMIKELGGWSITSNAPRVTATWDFVTVMGKLNAYGVSPFFSVDPLVNPKESSSYMWTFSPAKSFFARAEMLSLDGKYKHAFLEFGLKIGELLGNTNTVHLHALFTQIWDLEVALVKKTLTPVQSRDPNQVNNLMTLRDFQILILKNRFNIHNLMKLVTTKSLVGSDKVNVRDVAYFREMQKLLETTSSDVKANYMMFKMVQLYAAKLGYAFQEAYSIKKRILVGTDVMDENWKICVFLSVNLLPTPVAALYAEHYSNKSDIAFVSNMVQNIKYELVSILEKTKWMDAESRKHAVAKAKYIAYGVGYPEVVYDVAMLDRDYKALSLEKDNYFENYRRVKKFLKKNEDENSHVALRYKFDMPPTKANAYYNQDKVVLSILGGLLQYPFFNRRFNSAANYGSLGMIIGHEMSHGFDSRGKLYNEKGNLKIWWSKATEEAFNKKQQCFVKQYSNYTYLGVNNQGSMTVAENIADNIGIRLSYYAFKKFLVRQSHKTGYQGPVTAYQGPLPGTSLTEDQIFFLSFAQTYCGYYTPTYGRLAMTTDVHSVYPHRVLGTLSNMPEFSEAFKCKKGDAYDPAKRCKLF